MPVFRFDTETYPIRPGLLAPKLVCLQYAYDEDPVDIVMARGGPVTPDEVVYDALTNETVEPEAFNSAYDYAVLAAHNEDLIQPIFRMLAQKRGRDALLREQLISVSRGIPLDRKNWYGLDACAKRYCNLELPAGDSTRFALVDGIPPSEWAARGYGSLLDYAKGDITGLRAVSKAQTQSFSSPDEWFQCAAAFSLQLACVWGMRTDPVTLSWVETALLTRKEECERMLEAAGLLSDGHVSQLAVKAAVEAACERLGRKPPRTEPTEKMVAKGISQGNVKTDADTLEEIVASVKARGLMTAGDDPVGALLKYSDRTHYNKILKTYIQPMKWGIDQAMNYRLNTIVATGRTSSAGSKCNIVNPWWPFQPEKLEEATVGSNMQNFPREAGVRDCLIARIGKILSSTDYSALESRVLAQLLLWIVGKSVLAEGYQADPDFDPHTYFAGHLLKITYTAAQARHALGKRGDPEFAKVRAVAKNINFALPGGVGARKFKVMAAIAGLELTLEQCYYYIAEWKAAFPEMVEYFDWINWLVQHGKPYKQFVSGRVRGNIGYCDGCNSGFQGLGADISKYAMFLVSMACYAEPDSPLYGSRPLVLVHDEILAEHDIAKAQAANMEVKRLMELAEKHFLPGIPAKAEPTLMTRWIKEAKAVFHPDGRVRVDPGCWDLPFHPHRHQLLSI